MRNQPFHTRRQARADRSTGRGLLFGGICVAPAAHKLFLFKNSMLLEIYECAIFAHLAWVGEPMKCVRLVIT